MRPSDAPRRLLLIDDDDLVSLAFREYLASAGCIADSARDLPTARLCLAQRSYAAVWLDLQLTGTSTADCLRFLREVRESARGARLIAVSGYASPHIERQARAAGADCFLRKPFDPRAAAAMLREEA